MQIKNLRYAKYTSEIYAITSDGDVYNTLTGIKLKNQESGYQHVRIPMGDKYKNVRIHRAVAETFLGDISKGEVVNHIDGNKLNNKLENLEIISQSANVRHNMELRKKLKENGLTAETYYEALNQRKKLDEALKRYDEALQIERRIITKEASPIDRS